jgi:2-polyprenyl-6-hydroxyphenyl methylase / 3-demethylubiquinone-9 3-methyltransferase
MADDPVKKFQNLYEKDYVEKFEREQSPLRIKRLMQYIDLPKDSHVADFGCGNGMLLTSIYDKVRMYSGVDFSEPFIIAARNRQQSCGISNADFFCESIESFCSRNRDKFDAGFVMDLAEHVPDNEWAAILSAIHSSIKPGGKLYLHTPNAEFFLEIMKKKNFIFHQFEEHVAVRDITRNTRMLEDAGFFKVEVKLLPHYNILQYMHFLSFFPFIGKYFKARIFILAEKED